jgi:DNA topoisomerase-1
MHRHSHPADLLSPDPYKSALAVGLRYISDTTAGILRRRCGKGFRYVRPNALPADKEDLRRIRGLVIPPAWQNVWICASPHGHLQAVGWDAKGRKQYRYHPLYRDVRDQVKYSRLIAFGAVLALIRRRVERDLKRRDLSCEKVLATVVRLLETTSMRVGNAEYARDNESFGLTTLRNRHVEISGATLRFQFRGKSGQRHLVELNDRRLARIVRECQELPGYELFEYIDKDGKRCLIDSADVNAYLHEVAGEEFTAKDFRTWAGTVAAARELAAMGPCRNAAQCKKKIVAAVKEVARQLGNRPAASRKYYIHPAILQAFEGGLLFEAMRQGAEQEQTYNGKGLRAEEYAVLVILAKHAENLIAKARAA